MIYSTLAFVFLLNIASLHKLSAPYLNGIPVNPIKRRGFILPKIMYFNNSFSHIIFNFL